MSSEKKNCWINKLKKYLSNNKLVLLLILIVFIILMYCSLNTFIANDDLPYSFFDRTPTRVTNIVQIIKTQIHDYTYINPRVFIHSVVQFLLIFGKKLWSVLNPIVIILNFYIINKTIKLYIKKENKLFNYIFGFVCFLILFGYKWLIYWVAGSVNYVWTTLILFASIYLYLKYDFHKNYILNMLIILILSILHEALFVFAVIFVIFNIIYDYIFEHKINKKKFLLFIPLIMSGAFLFLSPAVLYRIDSTNWNNYNFFEKVYLSFPVISKNIYYIKTIHNVLPCIFISIVLLKLFRYNKKGKYIFIIPIISLIIPILVFENNWLYLVLSILLILSVFYINYNDNRNKLSLIFISFYGVAYSMCLTIEYLYGRPNYFILIFIILLSTLYIYDIFKEKDIKKLIWILIPILIYLLLNEIHIYTKIGKVHKERINSIENYSGGTLYLKELEEKYAGYHIDANLSGVKGYYTYGFFINYYNLPKNIEIEYIK